MHQGIWILLLIGVAGATTEIPRSDVRNYENGAPNPGRRGESEEEAVSVSSKEARPSLEESDSEDEGGAGRQHPRERKPPSPKKPAQPTQAERILKKIRALEEERERGKMTLTGGGYRQGHAAKGEEQAPGLLRTISSVTREEAVMAENLLADISEYYRPEQEAGIGEKPAEEYEAILSHLNDLAAHYEKARTSCAACIPAEKELDAWEEQLRKMEEGRDAPIPIREKAAMLTSALHDCKDFLANRASTPRGTHPGKAQKKQEACKDRAKRLECASSRLREAVSHESISEAGEAVALCNNLIEKTASLFNEYNKLRSPVVSRMNAVLYSVYKAKAPSIDACRAEGGEVEDVLAGLLKVEAMLPDGSRKKRAVCKRTLELAMGYLDLRKRQSIIQTKSDLYAWKIELDAPLEAGPAKSEEGLGNKLEQLASGLGLVRTLERAAKRIENSVLREGVDLSKWRDLLGEESLAKEMQAYGGMTVRQRRVLNQEALEAEAEMYGKDELFAWAWKKIFGALFEEVSSGGRLREEGGEVKHLLDKAVALAEEREDLREQVRSKAGDESLREGYFLKARVHLLVHQAKVVRLLKRVQQRKQKGLPLE